MITDNYVSYIAFDSTEALKYWISQDMKSGFSQKTYKVVHVKPVEVMIRTELSLKE